MSARESRLLSGVELRGAARSGAAAAATPRRPQHRPRLVGDDMFAVKFHGRLSASPAPLFVEAADEPIARSAGIGGLDGIGGVADGTCTSRDEVQMSVQVVSVPRDWLRPKEAAEYLGVAVSTLYSWRKRNLVRFYRVGPRAVALRREELDALAQQTVSDSEGASAPTTPEMLAELNQSMRVKYGSLDDSTPVIRAAREARSR